MHFPVFLCQALIRGGANIETTSLAGCSPLIFAADHGHLSVVKVMALAVSAILRLTPIICSLQLLNEQQNLTNGFDAAFGLYDRH